MLCFLSHRQVNLKLAFLRTCRVYAFQYYCIIRWKESQNKCLTWRWYSFWTWLTGQHTSKQYVSNGYEIKFNEREWKSIHQRDLELETILKAKKIVYMQETLIVHKIQLLLSMSEWTLFTWPNRILEFLPFVFFPSQNRYLK